jgi:hypothetical protein
VDVVLVQFPFADTGNKAFPDAGGVPARIQGVAVFVPGVEIADDGNSLSIGRPNGKVGSPLSVDFYGMASQLLIRIEMFSGSEKVDVVLREKRMVDDVRHCMGWLYRLFVIDDWLIVRSDEKIKNFCYSTNLKMLLGIHRLQAGQAAKSSRKLIIGKSKIKKVSQQTELLKRPFVLSFRW